MEIIYRGQTYLKSLRSVRLMVQKESYSVEYYVVFKNLKVFCVLSYALTEYYLNPRENERNPFYYEHQNDLLKHDVQSEMAELEGDLIDDLIHSAKENYFTNNNLKAYIRDVPSDLFIRSRLFIDSL